MKTIPAGHRGTRGLEVHYRHFGSMLAEFCDKKLGLFAREKPVYPVVRSTFLFHGYVAPTPPIEGD
jgi:hypothetical protein